MILIVEVGSFLKPSLHFTELAFKHEIDKQELSTKSSIVKVKEEILDEECEACAKVDTETVRVLFHCLWTLPRPDRSGLRSYFYLKPACFGP